VGCSHKVKSTQAVVQKNCFQICSSLTSRRVRSGQVMCIFLGVGGLKCIQENLEGMSHLGDENLLGLKALNFLSSVHSHQMQKEGVSWKSGLQMSLSHSLQ